MVLRMLINKTVDTLVSINNCVKLKIAVGFLYQYFKNYKKNITSDQILLGVSIQKMSTLALI